MQPPFYCDYGSNILLGERVFFNFNCVVLDVCQVTIGDYTLFGPAVQIYTATHPMNAELRRKQEFGKPIEIGSDVWVGGGAIICPGVRIGSRSVIGAGSVVTRDIPDGVFAAGNPCRVIREIADNEDSPGRCETRSGNAPAFKWVMALGHGRHHTARTPRFGRADVRQKYRKQANGREESANAVDEVDAREIGQLAQHGRADPAHAERESEKQARDGSHLARQQILRIHQNRGERRSQHQSDNDAERACPKKVRVGQDQRKGQHAREWSPR